MTWVAVCDICGVQATRVSIPGTPPFEWLKLHIEHFPKSSGTMVELLTFCPKCAKKFRRWMVQK